MNWHTVTDVAAVVCLVAGTFMSLAAAVGLVRFPDLLSRMHAGTKPQVLSLIHISEPTRRLRGSRMPSSA